MFRRRWTVAEGKIVYAKAMPTKVTTPKTINILEKGWRHPTHLKNIIYESIRSADLYDRLVCQLKHANFLVG
ncbi:MAG: hypothetical protein Ct9H90mP11_02570 [Acidimicrobiales bacterium]|nr:MAG: hypothetical protein Ct9H90mP11_02570 [Acidimicrobiales bacterium]